MKIEVKVHTKSGKSEVINDNGKYTVKLKSAPEDGKANLELIKLLQRHFKKEVSIKSGLKSKKKIIEVKE